MNNKILIVDTDTALIKNLTDFLVSNSFEVLSAISVLEASNILSKEKITALIVDDDLNTQADNFLTSLEMPILLMAKNPSMRSVILASNHSSAEYIAKPISNQFVLRLIDKLIEGKSKVETGTFHNLTHWDLLRLSAKSDAMQNLLEDMKKIAKVESKVLILGESGTGKELVATSIHQLSNRANKQIVAVNCAAIPHMLLESELFGYEKGAFTGATGRKIGLVEAAEGGSLFLDEIGELPLNVQASLLRLLQEGEIRRVGSNETRKVDVRIIAATNQNLRELVANGTFRLDLFYRLNVLTLQIPALRNRQEDILELSNILLRKLSDKLKIRRKKLSEASKASIKSHNWEGNIRELENRLERGLILCDGDLIQPKDMNLKLKINQEGDKLVNLDLGLDIFSKETSLDIAANTYSANSGDANSDAMTKDANGQADTETQNGESNLLNTALADDLSLEDYFLHFVLENQDNMTETQLAQKLGISRKSLWERRQKYGIPKSRPTNK